MRDTEPRLPVDLEVGVATSAWQIEGSVAARGRSIWDDFADLPGAIRDGATGEPACDHLRRMDEDLDLLSWLGVDAYRFSVSWPRVLPDGGTGTPSAAGLDVYDRLVDGLHARGIRPVATLYHWDLPSELQAAGGWTVRDTAERFADYATALVERIGDRVERWATLNEPWCAAFLGYAAGVHAPGLRDDAASLSAAYHLMLGHGLAVERLRAAGAADVGIALNLIPVRPADEDSTELATYVDGLQNRLFLDLLAGRGVPADVQAGTKAISDWSFVRDEDADLVSAPLDWVGENYYTVFRVGHAGADADAVGQDSAAFPGAPPFTFRPRPPLTDMNWEVEPGGLSDALAMIVRDLPGVPIWVTENGMATHDTVDDAGVHDELRVQYFRDHIGELLRAREAGVDVRGYLAWSLLDNLEWAEGWTKRFGIVRVEPGTLDRAPKDSARWWHERLAERSGDLA